MQRLARRVRCVADEENRLAILCGEQYFRPFDVQTAQPVRASSFYVENLLEGSKPHRD